MPLSSRAQLSLPSSLSRHQAWVQESISLSLLLSLVGVGDFPKTHFCPVLIPSEINLICLKNPTFMQCFYYRSELRRPTTDENEPNDGQPGSASGSTTRHSCSPDPRNNSATWPQPSATTSTAATTTAGAATATGSTGTYFI